MNMRVVVDMVVLEMKMTMIEFVETFDVLERTKFGWCLKKQCDDRKKKDRNFFQPVGPFKEGDPLTIMCVATGGEPPPSVLWYKENQIIDRSPILSENVIHN